MGRLDSIQTVKGKKPVRIMIYGIEGVGKTSLAADAPAAIFISPEGGTDQIQGAKEMPGIKTWDDVRDAIKELIKEKHDFKTLSIDSADWLEKLCHAKVIGDSGRSIITANGGYGAGYREAERLHRELIEDLSRLRDERHMNIIVTAHYQVKTVKDPESSEDYDAFEIKCHEMVSSLWREWVDCLLFARFRTYLKKDEDKHKGRALGDGTRVVYTEKRPAFQAKNRYSLPPEMDFVPGFWKILEQKIATKGTDINLLRAEIAELQSKVKDEELAKKMTATVTKAGDDVIALSVIRDRMKALSA